ncbi:hypothetical protein BJY00DRAFT_314902 [Aspergillus carlsbadensis]|nr:hypothetical protein BJY00DRAFT_314902 [Aspergillus carlsbadensis]
MLHLPERLVSAFLVIPPLTAASSQPTLNPISIPAPPQKIEADLIFPTNTTYAPLAYFPLIFGLTNAAVTWPLHSILLTALEPLDAETRNHSHTGKYEEWEPFPFPQETDGDGDGEGEDRPRRGGINFTIGAPPSDPFVYHVFPEMLRGFSAGWWRLAWEFGFMHSCSETSERVYDHWWDWGMGREVFFTITDDDDDGDDDSDSVDSDAHDVDESLRSWDCTALEVPPDEVSELTAAFEVLGWKTLGPEYEILPNYTYCPIFKNDMNAGKGATVPEPCRLDFGSSDIEAIVADARRISGCDGRTLGEMEWDCYGKEERMRRKWKWGIGVLVLVLGVYTVIAVGREWRVGRRGWMRYTGGCLGNARSFLP